MISPENRARMRRLAPVRAQIRILDLKRVGQRLSVTGRYYRVFSGCRHGAFPGRTVRFCIPLATTNDVSVAKLGEGPRFASGYLEGVRWLEVYLEREGEQWSLVYGQMLVIDHPSLHPQYC